MTVEDYNKAVDQYADGVYRFILKNVRDEENARDIVQDSFEKLWMHLNDVSAEKAKSYLFRSAYNRMIDIIRKGKRQGAYEERHEEEHAHEEQYSDVGEILNKAVQFLPEDQRAVLMLRDYEGYSYKEIAEITKLTEPQVKVYIYRARVFLKNYIGKIDVLV